MGKKKKDIKDSLVYSIEVIGLAILLGKQIKNLIGLFKKKKKKK